MRQSRAVMGIVAVLAVATTAHAENNRAVVDLVFNLVSPPDLVEIVPVVSLVADVDSIPTDTDMSFDISFAVNGSVQGLTSVPAIFESSGTCGFPCLGGLCVVTVCGGTSFGTCSAFPCTCEIIVLNYSGCKTGGTIILPLLPGDQVTATVSAAPGAVPETNTRDDSFTRVVGATSVNETIEETSWSKGKARYRE